MRIDKNCWMLNKPIAHRGLWGENAVENSLTAYKLASNAKLPIEIDVYLTKDEKIVVFHDDNLKRLTGEDALIFDKTYDELCKLNLKDSNDKIPLLKEVFEVVGKNSPLLIEIKPQPNKKIVDKVIEELKGFDGDYALQSFHHPYMIRVKKLAPHILRGVLGSDRHGNPKKWWERFLIKNMPLNFLVKPDFISYYFEGLPLKKRKSKNKAIIAWTITNEQSAKQIKPYTDNIIFENFDHKNLL